MHNFKISHLSVDVERSEQVNEGSKGGEEERVSAWGMEDCRAQGNLGS